MTNPMLAELDAVVRLGNEAYVEGKAYAYQDATVRALNFVLDYHATLADMAKDAARYRWLREQDGSLAARAQVSFNMGFDWYEAHGEGLDAAIDATQEGEG